ncbi:MAG: hypothetical protein IT281_00695 [Ignavibacteria bacterium]|nr:hypothetical protein [Ignavibacteria bacterium]
MERKDYVLRMIEEFARVIAKIVLLKQSESFTDAKTELDSLTLNITGLGLGHIKSLGAEGVKYVFSRNKETEAEKIYCIARIMKEDAMILNAQGNIKDSLNSYEIAKELFKIASELDYPEKEDAIKEFEELKIIK